MTISREEIRRVRALARARLDAAERATEEWEDACADLENEMSMIDLINLCDAAERGAEVTDKLAEIVKGWRHSVRDCDDDVGDVVREFADSIEAALGIDRPTPEEAGK